MGKSVGKSRLHAGGRGGLASDCCQARSRLADVAAGRLTPVLPECGRRNQGLSVVYPSHCRVSHAVKAFVAAVMRKFEAEFASYAA